MDTQEAIVKGRNYNPRLIGPNDSIEFTNDFEEEAGLDRAVENIREFTTIGNAKRKQAEDDKYRFLLTWLEPNNNVPERIYTIRAGGGNRTVTVTYVHSVEIIGRVDFDANSGGKLICYISDFRAERIGESGGHNLYRCTLTLQEI